MKRLLSTLQLNASLQLRYGLIYAAGFTLLMWIAVLRPLPVDLLQVAVPFALFADLAMIGFYFIAGAVLFEKDERTLYALVTTPLRFGEYLAAKLWTLTLLAVLLCVLLVLAAYGLNFNLLWLVLGAALCSLIGLLAGFIAVAPFRSISDFILPSGLILVPLGLPLVDFLGIWHSPLFYLIPTHGSLLLLRAAFAPISAGQIVYAIAYQLLWIGLLVWLAQKAFDRYIVRRGG